jgi:hypothetical protein
MIVTNETYSQHRYEINIVECAYNVVERMINEKVSKVNIGQYAYNLKIAIQEYKRSINYDVNASENNRKRACVISPTHPAFDFWLALHLSIEDPDEISMLLDTYQNGDFGDAENFIGHVEFFVIRIMKANIRTKFKEQKLAVINWVRENRAKHKTSSKEEKATINIHINIDKLILNKTDVALNVQVLNQINYLVQHLNFQQFNTFVNSNVGTQEENINVPLTEATDISQYEHLNTSNGKNSYLIPLELEYEEVFAYFMQLSHLEDHDHIKETDIEYLVKSNFKFKNITPISTKKRLTVNIAKQYLNKFVYDFYLKKDEEFYSDKAKVYCQFLIDNFSKFKNANLNYTRKNFSRKCSGVYPFKS